MQLLISYYLGEYPHFSLPVTTQLIKRSPASRLSVEVHPQWAGRVINTHPVPERGQISACRSPSSRTAPPMFAGRKFHFVPHAVKHDWTSPTPLCCDWFLPHETVAKPQYASLRIMNSLLRRIKILFLFHFPTFSNKNHPFPTYTSAFSVLTNPPP